MNDTDEPVIEYADPEQVREVGERMRIRYRELLDRLADR